MAKNIDPQLSAIGKYLNIDEDTVFVMHKASFLLHFVA